MSHKSLPNNSQAHPLMKSCKQDIKSPPTKFCKHPHTHRHTKKRSEAQEIKHSKCLRRHMSASANSHFCPQDCSYICPANGALTEQQFHAQKSYTNVIQSPRLLPVSCIYESLPRASPNINTHMHPIIKSIQTCKHGLSQNHTESGTNTCLLTK